MRRVVPIAAVLAACGSGGGGGGGIEAELGKTVSTQLGVDVTVTCPAGKFPAVCAVHVPGGDDLALDVTESKDAWSWTLRGFVIATTPLVHTIEGELADLGLPGEVDCGPALRVTHVGERIRCALDVAGGPGAAWATILDDDARFELELAVTAAAVAARTEDVDQVALEKASRALDRDDAEGVAEDDDGTMDAGVALDSAR